LPYCPECGGETYYDRDSKRYICKSCGLSVTYEEFIELREKIRPEFESEDKRKRRQKEYLQWWLQSKKEKK
jgi:transcription initiation factor TFIIIB Brf1 subunit/transcription initiation factor TFIIB